MDIREADGKTVIALPKMLDLSAAQALRDLLLETLSSDVPTVVLQAEGVQRSCTAIVQVVLVAVSSFQAMSRSVEIQAAPEAFLGPFQHLGVLSDIADCVTS